MTEANSFWEWYGTRLVWNTIGNGYCPYCEGDRVAAGLFWWHLWVGVAISLALWQLGAGVYGVAIPPVALGSVGVFAAGGFLSHLYGWQDDRVEMVEELAEEYDADVAEVPADE